MWIIIDTHNNDLAIPADSGLLAAIGEAMLVSRKGYGVDDQYKEADGIASLALVADAKIVRLGSDEATAATEADLDKAKEAAKQAELELAREKRFHEKRSAAHSMGLTDKQWRAQLEGQGIRYYVDQFVPVKEGK